MMNKDKYHNYSPEPLWPGIINNEEPPLIIAGPCSAETREQLLSTARELHGHGVKILRAGIWKPRTYPGDFEGVGEDALSWLIEAKMETGMLVGTEVGTAAHTEKALGAGLDFLWIGARTTASPFAIQEIAEVLGGSSVPVLVKNPLNPSIDFWKGAVYRLLEAGVKRIGLIHRGFDIGVPKDLRNTPLWSVVAEMRRDLPHLSIYLDPSHIAGRRDYLGKLIQVAYLLKYDGIMIESHLNPDKAWSDRNQQITPSELAETISNLPMVSEQQLYLLRDELRGVDERLLLLLSIRRKLSGEIGGVKRAYGLTAYQETQYLSKLKEITSAAKLYDLPEELLRHLYAIIHDDSVFLQK
ncbi:bifunctional 3-deoxy-7-phosphoheptulonate synthase/chorismate mutase type II [Porphyromonas sp.]|uniref:bifunctional 3-deoxy-7-phosphoheptulonate synthase/chorismate mutase type II n=1 Tax=Porphyromonas sp. TaxID=1924944 RepID=UPI002A75E959|nr:bifunctional 3-deoxy-7-phosphoheptulonate synthase/chorismate mutase type II [Porphyromonas sp.]MDY3066322.1 bifunctional 3-deoxy-7-phosphoheptulonate synthase/chorismate mutase type II [Porphyromonas sp.]